MPKVQASNWHLIGASSFEERCLALAEWITACRFQLSSATILSITNPPSAAWTLALGKRDTNQRRLLELLTKCSPSIIAAELGEVPTRIARDADFLPPPSANVLLDISTMPRKLFMYFVRDLLSKSTVENLVVCYSRPVSYSEEPLYMHADPPNAIPGFGRLTHRTGFSRLVIGLGYVGLGVDDLIQSGRTTKIDFIFPFPPASPASRRNWKLLSRLAPIDAKYEVHRVHAHDAFHVATLLSNWTRESSVDFLALGPKPQALGACLAHIKTGGALDVRYTQPNAYHASYSEGIARSATGIPDILAYCLKRDGKVCF